MRGLEVAMDTLVLLPMMFFAHAFDITIIGMLYMIWRELRAMRIGR